MDGRKKPGSNRVGKFGSRQGQVLGASAVATVWLGYILAGVGIGYLLDSYFHTSYWIPILLMVGAVAGFRDMIQTLNRVAKQEQSKREAKQAEVATGQSQSRSVSATSTEPDDVEEERPRPRIFAVPPPPQASFDKRSSEPSEELPQASSTESDTTDLVEKLMSDDQTSSQ